MCAGDIDLGRQIDVHATNVCTRCDSTVLGLTHGSFTILPQKTGFPPPLSTVAEGFRSQVRNSLLKHLQMLGHFAMRFSHLPSTWELS